MMLRLKKTFGFVAAVCMLGVLCGDFVSSVVLAATEIEEHGKMSVEADSWTYHYVNYLSIIFTGDAVGNLTITNEATGAKRSISLSHLQSGDIIWDRYIDDPGFQRRDTYTIEFAGKADGLIIADTIGLPMACFSGAGYGRLSNDKTQIGNAGL